MKMHGPIMGLLDPFVGYNFENMGTYITYGFVTDSDVVPDIFAVN